MKKSISKVDFRVVQLSKNELVAYQDGIKLLSSASKIKFKEIIKTKGFVIPFFIYVKQGIAFLLDGHQRLEVINELESEGYEIPSQFDCLQFDIHSEGQAKEFLLMINSVYGDFVSTKLTEFTLNLNVDNFFLKNLKLPLDSLELGLDKDNNFKLDRWNNHYFDLTIENQNPNLIEKRDKYLNGKDRGISFGRYIVPPFSVLDRRSGYWALKKKEWMDIMLDSGESRKFALGDAYGVSILDPFLIEILIKWFTPYKDNNQIFDPFSGDATNGFVSGMLKNIFTGIELRSEQVQLNRIRVAQFENVVYTCDDGQNVLTHIENNSQDLLISCPPYYNLEVYSHLENDASNQKTYDDFLKIIENAFKASIKALKDNRFAVIIVANIRDKKTGSYYNFVGDLVDIFTKNGMSFYNDIIILDPLNTAPARLNLSFATRKMVKVHQNVLVFFKGNSKKIKETFYQVELKVNE
ncbi:hypothetical protein DB313_06340 (plasmid) [Borrelia turcica IST7]|uniref:DNA methylase N-4/N-6 domain-containing protein n=1 Tax=Borrelia turcica IST7 TaxID=1104446 RepID=A0A386PQS3_9SPIR|nr:hypothetical protein [Borrelia turcica]AYE37119.1 hypothetical protein DB313_06340 [Borrelia turcica IST7]